MVSLYDFKTKRTIVLNDHDRVQRETLVRAGWRIVEPKAEPVPPIMEGPGIKTPPPPVSEAIEIPTKTPTHMGGIFEVKAEGQGDGPFVEVAAEKGEAENFLGGDFQEGGAQNFGGSNFEGDGGAVIEVTAEDKADLKDLESKAPAAVELVPEPVEEKKKAGARGRPVGSGKKPAHTWEGNLPD